MIWVAEVLCPSVVPRFLPCLPLVSSVSPDACSLLHLPGFSLWEVFIKKLEEREKPRYFLHLPLPWVVSVDAVASLHGSESHLNNPLKFQLPLGVSRGFITCHSVASLHCQFVTGLRILIRVHLNNLISCVTNSQS